MSEGQKIIKYCAIAFAILLAVGIISAIAELAFDVVEAVSGEASWNENYKDWNKKEKTIDFSQNFTNVESIDIENSAGKLVIRTGDQFRVEARNVSEHFKAKVNSNGELNISDNNKRINIPWLHIKGFNGRNSTITLYVPAQFMAKEARIDTGAGNVSIEGLNADYLYISAGAGNIEGSGLKAEKAKVDGGVGAVNLSDVNFNSADFDCGVGNLDIDGILTGKTKVDCGVGEVDFNLKGNVDDYGLDIDAGVGSIRLNGESMKHSYQANSYTPNVIIVDGGVGNVRINIKE